VAAHDASASQAHPPACLYVLATPIGNLADMGLRALHVLTLADALACEDTRHSQTLLRGYGIDKASSEYARDSDIKFIKLTHAPHPPKTKLLFCTRLL
jgi:16S rRNA C1402 (ribose-2'-O) methylase RsmI